MHGHVRAECGAQRAHEVAADRRAGRANLVQRIRTLRRARGGEQVDELRGDGPCARRALGRGKREKCVRVEAAKREQRRAGDQAHVQRQ